MCTAYTDTRHKRLDDDASLVSLSLQESDGVVFWMRRVAVLLKHKKLILGQPAHILQWLLSKKVVATPNLSSLTVVNPVLAKYFEHPRLTR